MAPQGGFLQSNKGMCAVVGVGGCWRVRLLACAVVGVCGCWRVRMYVSMGGYAK